jgi:hypothetical protein
MSIFELRETVFRFLDTVINDGDGRSAVKGRFADQ